MSDRDVFMAALDLVDPTARARFVQEACDGDPARRARVEALLVSHDTAGSFLGTPAVEPSELDETATKNLRGGRGELSFLTRPSRPDSLGALGHYEVLELLGRGGFGIVFRAFDEALQRVVAVKVLAPQLAVSSPPRKRFLREARSSAKVRHDNVVQVYTVEEQPLPYLVMEFIPGETLQQRIDRTGPLDALEVVRIGRQIAEGLAAAHATGLIHRDVKPANILIEAGPTQRVKITDFGLARAADDASLTQSGIVAGTPLFMAPEQASGESLDHRADLFSLGSVLYTMCTGRPPFRAPTTLAVLKRVAEDTPRPIQEIIPEVPAWLCEMIARLHAKKPADRFASAQEVADQLARRLAEMQSPAAAAPDTAALPAAEPTPASKPRSNGGRWFAVAAAFLLLVGGLGLAEATGVTKVRGTVIQFISPEGTLVVEVDDPEVSVKLDGSEVVITGAGAKEIRLKPGSYVVEASKGDKLLQRELVVVTKNDRRVLRVTQVPALKEGAGEKTDPDRQAAEYVLDVGGTVGVNGARREIRATGGLPREAFRLTLIVLHHKKVSDSGWANFKGCKNLTGIDLLHSPTSDAALAHFAGCQNLTSLKLVCAGVSDASLAHFAGCQKLTTLDLYGNDVSDAGLAHFKDRKGLLELSLGLTKVSDAGLAHFKGCKSLTYLSLNHTKVSDAGLAHFTDCKKLTQLELGETQVSDAGVARFTDCRELKELYLFDTKVSDAGLAHFKDCQELTTLWLWGTQVSDKSLPFLKSCKNLTEVKLGKTKVTAAGIDELKKALPKCKVEWDGN